MNMHEIKTILTNRLAVLAAQRAHAMTVGDLALVVSLDNEITETQTTLNQLETLAG